MQLRPPAKIIGFRADSRVDVESKCTDINHQGKHLNAITNNKGMDLDRILFPVLLVRLCTYRLFL